MHFTLLNHLLSHANVRFSYICFEAPFSFHHEYITAFSLFFSFVFVFLTVCMSGGRGRREKKRTERDEQTALWVKGADGAWYVSRSRPSRPAELSGLDRGGQEAEREGRRGTARGSKVEGSEGWKGRGLALGLFAALSLPLAALAHLHLCQLDVSQHVGVWRGENAINQSINKSISQSINQFLHEMQLKVSLQRYLTMNKRLQCNKTND